MKFSSCVFFFVLGIILNTVLRHFGIKPWSITWVVIIVVVGLVLSTLVCFLEDYHKR